MVVEDPEGRQVRLPEERWRHICARHPEMETLLENVQETVRQPDTVADSDTDPESVKLYHKRFPGLGLGNGWVRVAVKYLDDDAFILTAYIIGRFS